jgi:uncharacterized protein (TIGR02118 family)
LLKLVVFLRKADQLSDQEFRDWWLGDHAAIVRRFPGLEKYSVNIFGPNLPNSAASDWDGIAELWFADQAALDRAYESPVAREGMADTAAHLSAVVRVVADEHLIEPRPDGELRLPSGAWFRDRLANQSVAAGLARAGGYLNASLEAVDDQAATWIRIADGAATVAAGADPGAEAHYRLSGGARAWHKLLTGESQFPETVSRFGGLDLTGDPVRAAADMWALTCLFAACAGVR